MAERHQIEPHERVGYIYGLHDGDGTIRYIGQTCRLKARMTEHIIHAREGHRTMTSELAEWINSISVLHVSLLEKSVPQSILDMLERKWIEAYGLENLLNRETYALRGSRPPRTTRRGFMRFSLAEVISIRERVSRGETRVSIAREYGVNRDSIEKIVNRRTYP